MKRLNRIFDLLQFPFFLLKHIFSYTHTNTEQKNKKVFFVFVSFFIFLSGASHADDEPNDHCSEANIILSSGEDSDFLSGSSSQGDEDYFSFEVSANGTLTITISNDSTSTKLEYSTVSTTCPSNAIGALLKGTSTTITIPTTVAGTYYVYVEGEKNNPSTQYTISAVYSPLIPSTGNDLKITKESSTDTVLIYNPFYYSINVTNIGDTNASNVTITDTLPNGMSVDLDLTHADSPDWNCTGTTGTTTCIHDGNLTTGSISTITLHVNAPSTDGNITNTVTVASDGTDVNTTNNTATETTYITAEVDTAEHLCYTDTTDLTGDNAAQCEKIGNFYFGSGCDATVIVREVNATDRLSDVTVYKMYAPDTSSGTCDYTATATDYTGASSGTCNDMTNTENFGSYTEGYAVTLDGTDIYDIYLQLNDQDTDKNPRIDGVAMFADYWTELGFHHTGRIYDCNGTSEGGIEVVSSADVIDTLVTSSNANAYNNSVVPSQTANDIKYIRTMIASDTTREIIGVHLNLDGDAVPYEYIGSETPALSYSIIPYLTDDSCNLNFENIIDPNTNQQLVIDVPHTAYSAAGTMIVSNTVRESARMQMTFVDPNTLSVEGQQCLSNSSTTGNFARLAQCVNSEVQYKTAFGQDAWDRCGIGHGLPCKSQNNGYADPTDPTYNPLTDHIYTNELGCYMCTFNIQPVCSSDNFAIRPKAFDVNISDGDTFISGKPTNLKFEALNANDVTPTLAYNELVGDSFSVDINITDATKSCQIDIELADDVQFIDGIDTDDFYFTDVGKDLNFTVSEINGSEYALIDVDDSNDTVRFITSFARNINVIPDHFVIEANLTDHNSDHNFTYLHDINTYDFDDNHSMAAKLAIDIQAVGADGAVTRNYMETCYAEDTNLTLTLNSEDITYPGSNPPLTHFLYYNPAEDNGTADSGEGDYTLPSLSGITSLPIENIKSTFPADAPDGNGTTSIEYKLNFDRKIHLAVNPFEVDLTNVDIVETNVITPPVSGTTGTLTNQKATYYYARSRASQFFYEDITESNVDTPIIIDIYCDLSTTACSATGIDTILGAINEANWYVSMDHTPADGNVTLMVGDPLIEGTGNPTINGFTNPNPKDVTNWANGIDNTVNVDTNNSAVPLTVPIELVRSIDTPTPSIYSNEWLIYNPDTDDIVQQSPSPFYKVRFIGDSSWTGEGQTGYIVDTNASLKKHKKMDW